MQLEPHFVAVNAQGRELASHGGQGFQAEGYCDVLNMGPVPWHWHEEMELILITEGEAVVRAGKESYVLQAGEGLFVNSGVLHAARSAKETPPMLCSVVFHPRLVGGAPDSVFFEKWIQPLTGDADCGSLLLRPSVPWQKRVLEALEHTLEALRQAENGFEFTVRQELSQAVFLLEEKRIARPECPPDHTGRDGQRMKTMLKFVQEHFAEALTASQIAHSAGLSASECLRCFHAVIGTTPMQYVKTFRVQQAAQLLEGTDWPVAKVGRQCGFKEMGYFARAFREVYHCTPTEHRRAILQKKAGRAAAKP